MLDQHDPGRVSGHVLPSPSARAYLVLNDWEAGVVRYAADPALGEGDACEGRAFVERTYTPERIVEQWTAVLERVLHDPRVRRAEVPA